eukprot:PhF_6_TR31880/c0_g1_i1/m.47379
MAFVCRPVLRSEARRGCECRPCMERTACTYRDAFRGGHWGSGSGHQTIRLLRSRGQLVGSSRVQRCWWTGALHIEYFRFRFLQRRWKATVVKLRFSFAREIQFERHRAPG